MSRTEAEARAYVEQLIPDMKKAKALIIDEKGIQEYQKYISLKIQAIRRDYNTMVDGGTTPGIQVEEIVNFHNDMVDNAYKDGVIDLNWYIFNQQMNIIAGLIIRGYEI